MVTISTPKIINNPVRSNFQSLIVNWLFLIREIIPVTSAKKITDKTLSISVWY